jgi:hypothetical protein
LLFFFLSCVRISVADNNGFWTGLLELLHLLLQSPLITITYKSSQLTYCLGLFPFSFSFLNSLTTSELTTEIPTLSPVSFLVGPNILLNHHLQQIHYYCVLNFCCGNVSSDSLLSKECPSAVESMTTGIHLPSRCLSIVIRVILLLLLYCFNSFSLADIIKSLNNCCNNI